MISSREQLAPYFTFAVAFESQVVAVVPRLVPVTNTATYLLRCFDFSLKVLPVAPAIFLHLDLSTFVRAAETFLVQAYHSYVRVGVG